MVTRTCLRQLTWLLSCSLVLGYLPSDRQRRPPLESIETPQQQHQQQQVSDIPVPDDSESSFFSAEQRQPQTSQTPYYNYNDDPILEYEQELKETSDSTYQYFTAADSSVAAQRGRRIRTQAPRAPSRSSMEDHVKIPAWSSSILKVGQPPPVDPRHRKIQEQRRRRRQTPAPIKPTEAPRSSKANAPSPAPSTPKPPPAPGGRRRKKVETESELFLNAVAESFDLDEVKLLDEYKEWTIQYEKPVDSKRYPVWKQNYLMQKLWNRANQEDFELNQYGDCTRDEFEEWRREQDHQKKLKLLQGELQERKRQKRRKHQEREEPLQAHFIDDILYFEEDIDEEDNLDYYNSDEMLEDAPRSRSNPRSSAVRPAESTHILRAEYSFMGQKQGQQQSPLQQRIQEQELQYARYRQSHAHDEDDFSSSSFHPNHYSFRNKLDPD